MHLWNNLPRNRLRMYKLKTEFYGNAAVTLLDTKDDKTFLLFDEGSPTT